MLYKTPPEEMPDRNTWSRRASNWLCDDYPLIIIVSLGVGLFLLAWFYG